MLSERLKPYSIPKVRAALIAIGRSLPYLRELRRYQIVEQIPEWLTAEDIERLVAELERRSQTA